MKLPLAALLYICLVSQAPPLPAQVNVPPPPKPKDDGPTLEVTFKFLEETINALRKLNYIEYIHDNKEGSDQSINRSLEISQFRGNRDSCIVQYHVEETRNGGTIRDGEISQTLKTVKEIRVMSEDDVRKETYSQAGHPERGIKVEPPIYEVVLKLGISNIDNTFSLSFSDEILANRIAKAFNHAIELCGGGSKDPF